MHPKTFTQDDTKLQESWKEGPLSDQPLLPGHERPIYCLSMDRDLIVTGSADHSLRVYNIDTQQFERELFNQKYGHSEWVTACKMLADGRVLSAGMDSMLCLWDADTVMCDYMVSHSGPISKVMADDFSVAVTCSDDHTLIIWDLVLKAQAAKLAGPHKSPVLDFDWFNSLLVSGDKDGFIAFWDINTKQTFKEAKCHKGGVSQVVLFSDSMKHHLVLTTGISDGVLALHDMRQSELVYSEQLHVGAVNAVKVNLSNIIVTGGGDNTLNLVDIWSGFKHFGTMKSTSPVQCVETIHNLTIAGTEDGNILTYENDSCECLYGFGAMETGMVRDLQITEDKTRMVAIGDDVNPLLMHFV